MFNLANIDFSKAVEYINPEINPSFSFVEKANHKLSKLSDYGSEYDQFFSEIQVLVSPDLRTSVFGLSGTTILSSTHDVFFPGMRTTSANVGIVKVVPGEFVGIQGHQRVTIKLKLLDSLIYSTSTGFIQDFINHGLVSTENTNTFHFSNMTKGGYFASSLPSCFKFGITRHQITSYYAGEFMKEVLALRTNPIIVNLSNRHIGSIASKSVIISDVDLTSTEGRYTISFLVSEV